MTLYTQVFNDRREATKFINEKGLSKDDVLSFFVDNDGLYTLMYYAAE